jgi:hypothetical protein
LNEPERARSAKVWFYVSLGMLALYLVVSLFGAEQAVRGLALLYLVIWYFAAGRSQVSYVKAKYGNNYARKPWGRALLIAIASTVAYFVVALVLGVVAGLASGG